jgi:GNAT superfamily N-acetyltransferase
MTNVTIEKLHRGHNRKDFDCGIKALNKYLQKYARQNQQKNVSKTYILTDQSKTIYGFYSIASAAIDITIHPQKEELPNYGVPACLIGRLAVDQRYKGKGYGKLLLFDAFKKTITVADNIGIYCISVDAKDQAAKQFYRHFGFSELLDDANHLYISLKKVKKLNL